MRQINLGRGEDSISDRPNHYGCFELAQFVSSLRNGNEITMCYWVTVVPVCDQYWPITRVLQEECGYEP